MIQAKIQVGTTVITENVCLATRPYLILWHFKKVTVVVHMALLLRQSITLPAQDDVTNFLILAFKPFKQIFVLFLRLKNSNCIIK